jgi:enoyl-[acyl-carrier protein] reductase III
MRALVTGGTKGIGRAVALRLAAFPDARLALNYLSDEGAAAETAAEVVSLGGEALLIQEDACSLEGAGMIAERVSREFGGLDILVHCAVTPIAGSALDTDADEFRRGIERNGLSFLWLVRACRDLFDRGSSAILLTSGGSTRAVPNYAPLGGAKALAESLVRYLAAELAPRGIRVNAVSSGAVDTAALRAVMPKEVADQLLQTSAHRNPSGRALEPADVAGVVAMLVSPDSAMVQGQVIRVDGGLGLL